MTTIGLLSVTATGPHGTSNFLPTLVTAVVYIAEQENVLPEADSGAEVIILTTMETALCVLAIIAAPHRSSVQESTLAALLSSHNDAPWNLATVMLP